jgi:hypothetical protein
MDGNYQWQTVRRLHVFIIFTNKDSPTFTWPWVEIFNQCEKTIDLAYYGYAKQTNDGDSKVNLTT